MDNLANLSLLETMLMLLPGFVTAEIIGILVLREERKTLDRVIQALIYTFLVHLLWAPFAWVFSTGPKADLVGLGLCAILLGLILTWTINTGAVHGLLRSLNLTKAASRPNEWYDAFYDKQEYVILHLKDGRRLFGWPRLYPFKPDKGHILLEESEWLDRPGRKPGRPKVDLLIDVSEVRFVEFLPLTDLEDDDA